MNTNIHVQWGKFSDLDQVTVGRRTKGNDTNMHQLISPESFSFPKLLKKKKAFRLNN
jgi:hypothetical protein